MPYLVLIRHGESIWNKLNLFTGWVDVPLSENGLNEAIKAGELLKNYKFDIAHTSELIRAMQTLMIVMSKNIASGFPKIEHESGKMKDWGKIYDNLDKIREISDSQIEDSSENGKNYLPVYKSWRLNERYYGKLQGINKDEASKIYGKEKVFLWRRSYDIAPPGGESLKDTSKRTVPYFKENIIPELQKDKNIIVSAHGNSLRSIVSYIENLSTEEIPKLNIPTGVPLFYKYDVQEEKLERIGYLIKKDSFINDLDYESHTI
ncbi:MAG: 2,3-bisphosphoglycerate-dependent phosphoglycerate mutase [Methanothermococcus sp.]|jgi:2,3-bisphosphoglycerate-dependent phosphoglycerate mutase|uniref:2,3-bisphosphoglycerate-dependent phosphoglycerate mutase n=1 Tax=Methanothermococcus TaxID=155862 RepID=UPI00037B3933|nr:MULTISPECIES: 2,3-bisphosphoglycerate-dependent phosphoglycerate mutase [Methanothermococcus]MDK2790453.1 2,3-bisphosphoglycerate-dependent phosphoglycerate mutase [Methanothermococcus sp.]MDK2987754.1 2,3-bisphosphoglycerate-dependent phosphoglycerate mutase [Methanothermococcus sp.]